MFKRYLEKIKVIEADPYELSNDNTLNWSRQMEDLPELTYFDLYEFFIERTSFYTKADLKVYKGLLAYDYFVSGHVLDSQFLKMKNCIVLVSKVSAFYCCCHRFGIDEN